MQTITVSLSAGEFEALKRRAKAAGVSVSDLAKQELMHGAAEELARRADDELDFKRAAASRRASFRVVGGRA